MLGHEQIFAAQLEILYRYEDLKANMKEQCGEDAWFLSYIYIYIKSPEGIFQLFKCSFAEYDSFKQISCF